jgi:ABC-type Zn uptake system ZnuABC Zn-binding protein ZnuA
MLLRQRRRSPSGALLLVGVLSLLVAMLLAACGDGGSSSNGGAADPGAVERVADFVCPDRALDAGKALDGPADAGRLRVVTTVAPLTSIVANVAGDRADVVGVVPEGTNSHTYEPKPSVAADLAEADVVFVNGLRLEEPVKRLAERNAAPGSQLIELGTLALDEDQYLYDFSFPRDGGKPNPHLWTNPPMAACYARTVAGVLARADPAGAPTYRANADAYVAKVDELDRLMAEATRSLPADDRELLTYHDAYAYFAAHYGWTVIGAIQVSSFEDPSPKEVARLIDQVRDEDVQAVFGSEVFPSPVLDQIADETGAAYVDDLRDDDLPGEPGDPEHSYLGLMRFDFVTMVEALGGDASGLEAFDPSDVTADAASYAR